MSRKCELSANNHECLSENNRFVSTRCDKKSHPFPAAAPIASSSRPSREAQRGHGSTVAVARTNIGDWLGGCGRALMASCRVTDAASVYSTRRRGTAETGKREGREEGGQGEVSLPSLAAADVVQPTAAVGLAARLRLAATAPSGLCHGCHSLVNGATRVSWWMSIRHPLMHFVSI